MERRESKEMESPFKGLIASTFLDSQEFIDNIRDRYLERRMPKDPHWIGVGPDGLPSLKLPCRPVGTKNNKISRARMHRLGIILPETKESG